MWRAARIVVGTDFSKTAGLAVRTAFALARRMDSRVDLLHVLQGGPQPLTGYAILDEILTGGGPAAELPERALATLGELGVAAGPPQAECHVLEGSPAEELCAQRRRLGADLLVLGGAGLRSVRRFILGSVADRALRHPGCPLLLVNRLPPAGEYKKLLIGVEHPDRRSAWLETGLALAHHLRAEAILLHVAPPRGYVSDEHQVELDPRSAPERLRTLASAVDRTIPMQITVRRGDAATVIPRVARQLGADLVVLGAERGPEGWPGRVADRVARAGLPSLLYVWPGMGEAGS